MKTNHRFLVVTGVLILIALACARASTSTATPFPSLPAGEFLRSVGYDGLERSYVLYVPGSVNWALPVSLVLVFHGGTGNAENAMTMSGFNEVADRNGFLVIYPNGTGRLSDEKLLTWNGGGCCGFAQEQDVDDVGFVRAIVEDLRSLANVDPKRIYATGMSNGGILSHRLACEASDLFAAIAPVAGTLNFTPCNPADYVSVIEFHGTGDQNLPYDGGVGSESLVDVDYASVQDSIGFWVAFNGCDSQPQRESFSDIQHETWSGCTGQASVELYTILGGGHAWPGGVRGRPSADEPTQTISASQLIWEFFAAHPKH
jgi:polyhydroxybutyrate depolymerase